MSLSKRNLSDIDLMIDNSSRVNIIVNGTYAFLLGLIILISTAPVFNKYTTLNEFLTVLVIVVMLVLIVMTAAVGAQFRFDHSDRIKKFNDKLKKIELELDYEESKKN